MLYFSQSPIDPEKIDVDQFSILKKFKESMRLRGLTESYSGIPDFRQKFGRQLGINLNTILASDGPRKKALDVPTKSAIPKIASIQIVDPAKKLTAVQIREYITRAIESTARFDGWANIAAVGLYLRTYTPFDCKNYGFKTLKKYLESTGFTEVRAERRSDKASGLDSADVRIISENSRNVYPLR